MDITLLTSKRSCSVLDFRPAWPRLETLIILSAMLQDGMQRDGSRQRGLRPARTITRRSQSEPTCQAFWDRLARQQDLPSRLNGRGRLRASARSHLPFEHRLQTKPAQRLVTLIRSKPLSRTSGGIKSPMLAIAVTLGFSSAIATHRIAPGSVALVGCEILTKATCRL
ncbi:hypothetical protein BDZ90DRAFT_75155 [Jaminaea rosea]|uniref:Uncharacterized protein n=1 Tax=Jaminaea rosea TaxID=1569628 RepID=A0A316UKU4_9BASI|nr:hypothetical protein BDZ90DRAFT_75155 [Jaminaea rosea]PWN25428.1 hypothetical protein BDZ90DRAFT_75155 [Jaminaea rosea]